MNKLLNCFVFLNTMNCKTSLYFIFYHKFYSDSSFVCTTNTAKILGNLSHWQSNTILRLSEITEALNVDDFCELITKVCFLRIRIDFTCFTSITYQNNFRSNQETISYRLLSNKFHIWRKKRKNYTSKQFHLVMKIWGHYLKFFCLNLNSIPTKFRT